MVIKGTIYNNNNNNICIIYSLKYFCKHFTALKRICNVWLSFFFFFFENNVWWSLIIYVGGPWHVGPVLLCRCTRIGSHVEMGFHEWMNEWCTIFFVFCWILTAARNCRLIRSDWNFFVLPIRTRYVCTGKCRFIHGVLYQMRSTLFRYSQLSDVYYTHLCI